MCRVRDAPRRVNPIFLNHCLLEPQRLETLIKDELASPEALKNYREMVDPMRAYPDDPMTMDEIQADVDAVRAERAARENRR